LPSANQPGPEPASPPLLPSAPISRKLSRTGTVWLACGWLLLWFLVFSYFRPGFIVDEAGHQRAVERISQGEWASAPYLVMLPGYHALLAGPSALLGPSLYLSRLLTFLMSLATLFLLAAAGRQREGPDGVACVLLLAFLPVYFPYTCLIYTDAAAVLFLVAALWAQVRRRYWLSAVALFLACLMRQSSVVWGGFFVAWSALEVWNETGQPSPARPGGPEATGAKPVGAGSPDAGSQGAGYRDAACRDEGAGGRLGLQVRLLLPRVAGHLLVLGGVGILLVFSGQLLSEAVPENRPQPNIGNFYILGLLALLLWAPIWLSRLRSEAASLITAWRARPWSVTGILTLSGAAGALLVATYDNWHPWNQDPIFLRNLPLTLMDAHPAPRIAGVGAALLAGVLLIRYWHSLPRRGVLLLVGIFTMLFLLPHSLVEARYGIVPFLFADFFAGYTSRQRRRLAIWYLALSLLVGGVLLANLFVLW
jgi:hypothetical protein